MVVTHTARISPVGRRRSSSCLGPWCEEARTPRKGRGAKDHRDPNHISKMVLSIVHFGPTKKTRTCRPSLSAPLKVP